MKPFSEDVFNKFGHPVGIDVDPTSEKPPKNFYVTKKKPARYKSPVKEASDPGENKVVNKKVMTTAKDEKKKTKQAAMAQKVLDVVKGKKHKIDVEPTVGQEHVKVQ